MIIGWDAAHIIMDCRHHRQRLPRQINARENLARLRNARQTLGKNIGVNMVQVKVDMILLLAHAPTRSEEHTSELQSLMRISYAVFCLKQQKKTHKKKHLYNL